MTMRVGTKTIEGEIQRRDEARKIYEEARDQGYVASLLDQERPNVFTQSVANIMPGEREAPRVGLRGRPRREGPQPHRRAGSGQEPQGACGPRRGPVRHQGVVERTTDDADRRRSASSVHSGRVYKLARES